MGRLFVCALFFSFVSTEVWASSTDDLTPAELAPAKTSFAYRVRHSWNPLPDPALSAMWFNGEDRYLPRETVAEPIVVLPAQTARHTPSRNALCSHAAAVAAEHDLPVPFFANLIQQESGFKSHVVSPAGAQGIAQFMPRVARAYGLENPFDPTALAVGVGQIPARAARPVRQHRPRRRRLQRGSQARAGLDGAARQAAG